jgi:hypothetical protein
LFGREATYTAPSGPANTDMISSAGARPSDAPNIVKPAGASFHAPFVSVPIQSAPLESSAIALIFSSSKMRNFGSPGFAAGRYSATPYSNPRKIRPSLVCSAWK